MSNQEEVMQYTQLIEEEKPMNENEMIFEIQSNNPTQKRLNTNLDLKKLGLGEYFGDSLDAPRLVEKIDGVTKLLILRYSIHITKSPLDYFKWEDIESQLITEIKTWYKKQNVTSSKAVYTVRHDIPK